MRVLLTCAAFLLLAGCAFPGSETSTSSKPNLFSVCPQWLPGDVPHTGSIELEAGTNTTDQLIPADNFDDGRPLDLIRITIDAEAAQNAQLRAFRTNPNGTQGPGLAIVDYRDSPARPYPFATFQEPHDDLVFDVYLSPATQGSAARPGGIYLEWRAMDGTFAASYDAAYHYRVCGTPLAT